VFRNYYLSGAEDLKDALTRYPFKIKGEKLSYALLATELGPRCNAQKFDHEDFIIEF